MVGGCQFYYYILANYLFKARIVQKRITWVKRQFVSLRLKCPGYCREFKQTMWGFGESTVLLKKSKCAQSSSRDPGSLSWWGRDLWTTDFLKNPYKSHYLIRFTNFWCLVKEDFCLAGSSLQQSRKYWLPSSHSKKVHLDIFSPALWKLEWSISHENKRRYAYCS